MTDTDDIDEQRAKALFAYDNLLDCREWHHASSAEKVAYLHRARRIRLSDEAAGYILIKHEGIISSEGMKPVEVE